jgi:hypothetical protein
MMISLIDSTVVLSADFGEHVIFSVLALSLPLPPSAVPLIPDSHNKMAVLPHSELLSVLIEAAREGEYRLNVPRIVGWN